MVCIMSVTYSKKDLKVMCGIARTTVLRTLTACGLSTAKTHYTQQEIREYFLPARRLYEAGYTTTEVHAYFGIKKINEIKETTGRRLRHQPQDRAQNLGGVRPRSAKGNLSR